MKILHAINLIYVKELKNVLLVIICTFLLFPLLLSAGKLPLEWTLDTTVDNVEFYHSIVECGGKKVVFLKFKNNNSNNVKVSWKEIFTTQELGVSKLEGPFLEKKLILAPGESSQADCENTITMELMTRPDQKSPVYAANIVKFDFKDIKVIK